MLIKAKFIGEKKNKIKAEKFKVKEMISFATGNKSF